MLQNVSREGRRYRRRLLSRCTSQSSECANGGCAIALLQRKTRIRILGTRGAAASFIPHSSIVEEHRIIPDISGRAECLLGLHSYNSKSGENPPKRKSPVALPCVVTESAGREGV